MQMGVNDDLRKLEGGSSKVVFGLFVYLIQFVLFLKKIERK
jgi:hypothetical protein